MHTLIFADRDGTINKDENYYLGTSPDWKSQVSFLPGVIEGIKLLNSIPKSKFFILTNQSGVALKGGFFDNLTLEKMYEVNEYIMWMLRENGLRIDGAYACPYVDSKYVQKAQARGKEVNSFFVVDNHPDLKPNTGMLEKAIKDLSLDRSECSISMIGDRASDVEMGLYAGGRGILVPGSKTKELGDIEKVKILSKETYIATNFLDAAQFIYEQTKK